jgi:hypothetical protein
MLPGVIVWLDTLGAAPISAAARPGMAYRKLLRQESPGYTAASKDSLFALGWSRYRVKRGSN